MNIVISQPMNGLTREQIEANREAVVNKLVHDGHTIMETYVTEETPKNGNEGLFCLGKSFIIIAQADAVYFMDGWQAARGCWMEFEACKRYGIKTLNA
jgi:hypothetical protein